MNCINCGIELKEGESICPICQAVVGKNEINISEPQTNSNFENYKETEKLNAELGLNKMLVFSIFELICCNQLFGIAALLLLFLKFKPAIEARNLDDAKKTKKIVIILLIVGAVIGLLVGVLNVVLTVFAEMLEYYNV